MDGWSDVVRQMSLANDHPSGELNPGVALFIISFMVIVGIIVMNIVIAILLEGVTQAIENAEKEEAAVLESKERRKFSGPLDPLLATLATFTSEAHLDAQIKTLFQILDDNDDRRVNFEELKTGLGKISYQPPITITTEDWHNITNHGEW